MFDKDAVYINVPGHFSKRDDADMGEGERIVMSLQDSNTTLGDRAAQSELRLFDDSSAPVSLGRERRRAAFGDDVERNGSGDDESEQEEEDDAEDVDAEEEEEDDTGGGRSMNLAEDEDDEQVEEVAYAESDSDLGLSLIHI